MENWQNIKVAFSAARGLGGDERLAFLQDLEPELRSEVGRLLTAEQNSGDFIGRPFVIEQGLATDRGEDLSGVKIDDYELLQKIGSGGMGTVYLAEQRGEGFSRKVALKLLKPDVTTNELLKRFLTERQILANLDHQNIARLYDTGTTADGLPYFVMEFIEGDEIRKYCDANRLILNERLELFLKVCSAVSEAHRKIIVHRDIKPTNILVTSNGEPKLLDFGIAKLIGPDCGADGPEMTLTIHRALTPEYASPEQMVGEQTTVVSDVYSLGVVLYELVTGVRPFGDRDSREIDSGLESVILRAMRPEPGRRYQSVQGFSDDIRGYLDGTVRAVPVNKNKARRSLWLGEPPLSHL